LSASPGVCVSSSAQAACVGARVVRWYSINTHALEGRRRDARRGDLGKRRVPLPVVHAAVCVRRRARADAAARVRKRAQLLRQVLRSSLLFNTPCTRSACYSRACNTHAIHLTCTATIRRRALRARRRRLPAVPHRALDRRQAEPRLHQRARQARAPVRGVRVRAPAVVRRGAGARARVHQQPHSVPDAHRSRA
jgi:hypothetical protein